MSSGCGRRRRASSSRCSAAAPAPSLRSASRDRRCRRRWARISAMEPMRVPSRTIGDHLAENICLFGLLAATCSKIAREIYTLMKTEFGEGRRTCAARHGRQLDDAAEAQPQARARTSSLQRPRFARSVPLALEAMQTEHEADRTTSLIMDAAEARASIALGDASSRRRRGDAGSCASTRSACGATPRSRAAASIMAEAVMLDLGARIGRCEHARRRRSTTRRSRPSSKAGPSPSCSAADPRVSDASRTRSRSPPRSTLTAYTGLRAETARDCRQPRAGHCRC